MRGATLGMVLLASCSAPFAQVPSPQAALRTSLAPPPDDWLGRDKALHAGTSFALTLGGALALRAGLDATQADATALALGTTLAIGLTKEVADARRPNSPLFSWRDLAADAVGAALGALVASL